MEDMDRWNTLKKQLTERNSVPLFRAQEVWWCSIGLNVGYEIYGKGERFTRPVLVLKKKSANTFIGIPMSTRIKDRPDYHVITFKGKQSALLFGEIRNLDARRLADRYGKLSDPLFAAVEAAVSAYFKPV